MTDADKIMNPLGSDPADIRMRIRINPEIRIRIHDPFWFGLETPWRRFALSEHSLDLLVDASLTEHIAKWFPVFLVVLHCSVSQKMSQV